MYTYIRKLQKKEEGVRKQILVASLVFSMVVVGSVWVYSLSDRFGAKQVVADTTASDQTTKPFALFTQSITDAYKNITASVGNISFSKKADTTTGEKQVDLIVVEDRTE